MEAIYKRNSLLSIFGEKKLACHEMEPTMTILAQQLKQNLQHKKTFSLGKKTTADSSLWGPRWLNLLLFLSIFWLRTNYVLCDNCFHYLFLIVHDCLAWFTKLVTNHKLFSFHFQLRTACVQTLRKLNSWAHCCSEKK